MGNFIARTGILIDYSDIYDTDEQVSQIFNKDLKITNGRLLINVCETTEIVLVDGRLNNWNSGDYTCTMYNEESAIDYFIVDYDGFDNVSELAVSEFHSCLSDVTALWLWNQKI